MDTIYELYYDGDFIVDSHYHSTICEEALKVANKYNPLLPNGKRSMDRITIKSYDY